MGVEQDEGEKVNGRNTMKNFLESNVKELAFDFESTPLCKTKILDLEDWNGGCRWRLSGHFLKNDIIQMKKTQLRIFIG